jgi:heat-inducible transcriptional repressor
MRKLLILKTVVELYIQYGEPVGSRVIADQFLQSVSSATIRNDMAALEQLGYLQQPHTSAGRIPTNHGYRFYISQLMKREPLSEENRELIDTELVRGDLNPRVLVENATDLLSRLTGCASVSATGRMNESIIMKVDVIPVSRRLYALILITSSGAVENRVCRLDIDLTPEQIAFFVRFIRENITGMRVEEMTNERLVELGMGIGAYNMALAPLLYGVYDITRKLREQQVTIKHEANLLKQGILQDNDLALLLEEKQRILMLLESDPNGLTIRFGGAGGLSMENSSLIICPYRQAGGILGYFGVIGPRRMDYGRIIPYVEYLSDTVTRLLTEGLEEDRSKPARSRWQERGGSIVTL